MRTIKFKAWDKLSKSWVKVNEFSDLDNNGQLYPVWTVVPESDVELIQFTGLLDKNGKEIYEGDIVQDPQSGYEPRPIYEIIWWEEKLAWAIKDELGGYNMLWPERNLKVIGNIYENPELLN